MSEVLSYGFIQNAILAGIMASVVCGVIGPFIVARRMVFISGGLSHTAFGGLGIAYWLGIHPLCGATAFVLAAAVLIARIHEKHLNQNDLAIGILWAVGVAIGIIFIHLTPGYAPDLMTFLFGNILTVSPGDLLITLLLVLTVTAAVVLLYRGFVAVALDEEYAKARRLPVASLKMGLMVLTALSIVTLLQVVGILLVIALLTLPVAIASELARDFRRIMLLSILCGIVACLAGLLVSYVVELPSGASIILIGGALLGLVRGAKRLLPGRKSPPPALPQ
ncbi:MAG: metal ABC transporter permease [Syntrophales bacterium]